MPDIICLFAEDAVDWHHLKGLLHYLTGLQYLRQKKNTVNVSPR